MSINGHKPVTHVTRAWYVVCESAQLRKGPIARTLLDTPLVLFRDNTGTVGALQDWCPHRNVPLSLGDVVEGDLQCRYHGWRYDACGNRTCLPGITGDRAKRLGMVPSYPVREQDGYVWVYGAPAKPDTEPYRLPCIDEPGYTTVRRIVDVEGTVHAALENALDVPHTAFLHRGLFRGTGKTNRITAVLTRTPDSAQVEYMGEPRPEGIAAKILSPSGGVVQHFDRFLMPSIGQVEYRLGEDAHVLITSLCTPIKEDETRMFAVISFRSRIPGFLVKLALNKIGVKIFAQDAWMLKEQTHSIRRMGGEKFHSTELDMLGPQILRLMRRAEEGLPAEKDSNGWRREVVFDA